MCAMQSSMRCFPSRIRLLQKHTKTARTTQSLLLLFLNVSDPHFQVSTTHCNLDKCTFIKPDGNDSILWEEHFSHYPLLFWLPLVLFSFLVGSYFICLSITIFSLASTSVRLLQLNTWSTTGAKREEGGTKDGGGREGEREIRRGIENGDKTGMLDTGTVNKCVIKTKSLSIANSTGSLVL